MVDRLIKTGPGCEPRQGQSTDQIERGIAIPARFAFIGGRLEVRIERVAQHGRKRNTPLVRQPRRVLVLLFGQVNLRTAGLTHDVTS